MDGRKKLYEDASDYLQCLLNDGISDSEISNTQDSSGDEEELLEEHFENSNRDQATLDGDGDVDKYENEDSNIIFSEEQTKWNLETDLKPCSHNILVDTPGVKWPATEAKIALECWEAFFSNELLQIIVQSTNEEINNCRAKFSRERDCKHTDLLEIRAFLGLLYMAGLHRSSKLNSKDLFAIDGSGIEIFRLVMHRNRFHFLLQTLRFDSIQTRHERKLFDKLAPIRQVFNLFTQKCHQNYSAGEFLCLDEMLVKFRGACGFRQYMPSKRGKCGMKMFALVDSKSFYTLNLEVLVANQPEGPFKVINTPQEIAQRICQPINGTGRTITGNDYFTSHNLAADLLNDNLTYVGPIKKSKREHPSRVLHQKCISYTQRDTNVLILSSMHTPYINESTGEPTTPDVVTFYNRTKLGVEVLEKLCTAYSVSRNSNRWAMALFFTLLNIGGINAFIVYNENNTSAIEKRRQFLKSLALQLADEHLKRRCQIRSLPTELRKRTAEVANLDPPIGDTTSIKLGCKKRCHFCGRKKNRKTKYTCIHCHTFICLEHANMVCDNCKCKYE